MVRLVTGTYRKGSGRKPNNQSEKYIRKCQRALDKDYEKLNSENRWKRISKDKQEE